MSFAGISWRSFMKLVAAGSAAAGTLVATRVLVSLLVVGALTGLANLPQMREA